MPSLLTTAEDFAASPTGAALNSLYGSSAGGFLDRVIIQKSGEVERYCRRKLGVPPATSISGSTPIAPGSSVVPVANVANAHPGDVAVFGDALEAIELRGAQITNYAGAADQYAGNLQLVTPTTVQHAAGATVTVYRQCRYMVRGARTQAGNNDVNLSQAGQLAAAHAPQLMSTGQNSLRIFLAEYPVWSVHAAYQVTPYSANTETAVNLSADYLMPEQGYFKLPFGFWNPPQSVWRVQYISGYIAPPEDLKDAVHLLVAEALTRPQNTMGATSWRMGDVSVTGQGSAFTQHAYQILDDGGYVRVGQ